MQLEVSNHCDIVSLLRSYKSNNIRIRGSRSLKSKACPIEAVHTLKNTVEIITPMLSLYGSQSPLPSHLNEFIHQAEDAMTLCDELQTICIDNLYALHQKIAIFYTNNRSIQTLDPLFLASSCYEPLLKRLQDILKTQVTIHTHVPTWRKLSNPTILSSNCTSKLGHTTCIGESVISSKHSKQINIGPISPEQYSVLLKEGKVAVLKNTLDRAFHPGAYQLRFNVTPWSLHLR